MRRKRTSQLAGSLSAQLSQPSTTQPADPCSHGSAACSAAPSKPAVCHSFRDISASLADQHRTTILCWHLPAPSQRSQSNGTRSFNQKPESSSVCFTARLLPFWLPSRAPQQSQGSMVPAAGTADWSIGPLSSESEPVFLSSLSLPRHVCNRLDL